MEFERGMSGLLHQLSHCSGSVKEQAPQLQMHTHPDVYALPFKSPLVCCACFAGSEEAEFHPTALTLHRLSQGARLPASDAPSTSVVVPADADLQNGSSHS